MNNAYHLIPYSIKLLPHIISKCGKFVYFQSSFNGAWWKHFLKTDRSDVFVGVNPPKNP